MIDSMRDAVHVFINGELIGKSFIEDLLLVHSHSFYMESQCMKKNERILWRKVKKIYVQEWETMY